jgi:hypothetical protein
LNAEGACRVAVPTAANLLDAPERALQLPAAGAAAMLAKVEGLAAVLRIAAAAQPAPKADRAACNDLATAGHEAILPSGELEAPREGMSSNARAQVSVSDGWLTPAEVALRLRRTRAWVYKRAKSWPFVTRPSRKTLLISERGLDRWLERH